jgi:hypothetical protein
MNNVVDPLDGAEDWCAVEGTDATIQIAWVIDGFERDDKWTCSRVREVAVRINRQNQWMINNA